MSNKSKMAVSIPVTAEVESLKAKLSPRQKREITAEIQKNLRRQNAVLIAHYYVDDDIQELAEKTGGKVSDSLDMAMFGNSHPATTLAVAGVRFMGETAKILNPEKRVLMAALKAECSLDLGCPADKFIEFCDQHPDRTVVVYSNTSAEVKARADYVVTSSIAAKLIKHLSTQGRKIIWAPDRALGAYIRKVTDADMLLWDASCVVHDEFNSRLMGKVLEQYPDAALLVHPESPAAMIEMADFVGSTTQIINAAKTLPNQTLIVATDKGIFYKMRQAAPAKRIIEAPTFGMGATCVSCAHCPWMAMNSLTGILVALRNPHNEITVAKDIREKAYTATKRMIDFAKIDKL